MTAPFKACPICNGLDDAKAKIAAAGGGGYRVTCEACGTFVIDLEGWEDELDAASPYASKWNAQRRAVLSHAVRGRLDFPTQDGRPDTPLLTTAALARFRDEPLKMVSAARQVVNIVRLVGDHESETGEPLERAPPGFYAIIGAASPAAANRRFVQAKENGLVHATAGDRRDPEFLDAELTLPGWDVWEEARTGRAVSRMGVIAMSFSDEALNAFVETVVKPAVARLPGITLHRIDDPEISRAGVIDNVMRETIRDAAFLIADLSHANNGAYWEAGYAEGLGKPVVYLCERSKWDADRTHFDTNHCTTIVWDAADPEGFSRQLVATLRNSLNLFARA